MKRKLNLRDLGGIPFDSGQTPHGVYLRSGKLSILSKEACARLCEQYHIACVIDLRTPVESAEFPDPLPEGVEFMQIPLIKNSTAGITHETGSDPIDIIRKIRKDPEQLDKMIPDFDGIYKGIVSEAYGRRQLDKAVATLRENASKGRCTLFHCTAGKDRSGILSMALLKSYGVSDEEIIKDYMRTNRNAFWPTIKKCIGITLLTWNWRLVKTAYTSFMANKRMIRLAIKYYDEYDATQAEAPGASTGNP